MNVNTSICCRFIMKHIEWSHHFVFAVVACRYGIMPNRPLLDKLRAVNVNPYILKWLASYLFNKMQSICVGGVTSQL